MPTQEAIVDNIIPKEVVKPIPTRTVQTRYGARPTTIAGQNINNVTPGAESPAEQAPVESVRLSAQVSAIARKEQAFRQKEQEVKEREKSLEARLAKADRFEKIEAAFKAKDFSSLEELGVNYEDHLKYQLDKQGDDPVQAEIKRLNAEIEALKKGDEESAAEQYQETIAEYKKEIKRLVADDQNFSSVKALGQEEAVLQLILDTFEQDGEELTISEAAKLVEDKLGEYGEKFTKLPKFQTKQVTEVEPEAPRALPRPIVGKTLTNDMTVNSEKRPLKNLQYLSEAERYAEARRRALEKLEKGT